MRWDMESESKPWLHRLISSMQPCLSQLQESINLNSHLSCMKLNPCHLKSKKKKKWIAFPSGAYYWMKGDVYKWKTTWQFSGNNLRIIIHSFHSLMIQYCRRKNYSSQGRSKSYDIHFYSSSHFIQQRAAAWNDRTKVLWNISKSRRNTRKSWTLFYASGCSPSSPWEWRPLGVQQSHQILKIHIAFKTKNKL